LERPLGIYASSLSRRGLARRRARMRHSLLARLGSWIAAAGLIALGVTIAQRLLG
jgi:hypothetical protein